MALLFFLGYHKSAIKEESSMQIILIGIAVLTVAVLGYLVWVLMKED